MSIASIRRRCLDRGGYDADGRYFGHGEPLYRIEMSNGYEYFARATSRTQAKAIALAILATVEKTYQVRT